MPKRAAFITETSVVGDHLRCRWLDHEKIVGDFKFLSSRIAGKRRTR